MTFNEIQREKRKARTARWKAKRRNQRETLLGLVGANAGRRDRDEPAPIGANAAPPADQSSSDAPRSG